MKIDIIEYFKKNDDINISSMLDLIEQIIQLCCELNVDEVDNYNFDLFDIVFDDNNPYMELAEAYDNDKDKFNNLLHILKRDKRL